MWFLKDMPQFLGLLDGVSMDENVCPLKGKQSNGAQVLKAVADEASAEASHGRVNAKP